MGLYPLNTSTSILNISSTLIVHLTGNIFLKIAITNSLSKIHPGPLCNMPEGRTLMLSPFLNGLSRPSHLKMIIVMTRKTTVYHPRALYNQVLPAEPAMLIRNPFSLILLHPPPGPKKAPSARLSSRTTCPLLRNLHPRKMCQLLPASPHPLRNERTLTPEKIQILTRHGQRSLFARKERHSKPTV